MTRSATPGSRPSEAAQPSAAEVAAILAAIERFRRDATAPPAEPAAPSRWVRTGLAEGVGRRDRRPGSWGGGPDF